jgi:thymidylate synthase (FAD)
MGTDSAIVQAARVSYGEGTKTVNQDAGLINYLLRHKHTTPFEMCEIKFHVKMPIFVARQWARHRTANVNEISGRYSIITEEFHVPEVHEICEQSKGNKQGRDKPLNNDKAIEIQTTIREHGVDSFATYNQFLSEANMARELARVVLPQGAYTEMYWKIDLHNLLHFLHLRADSHAQEEIRVYAVKMLEIVKMWVPLTHAAFVNYRQKAMHFSALELDKIKEMLDVKKVQEFIIQSEQEKGELRELGQKLNNLI